MPARRNQGFEARIKELGYTVVASLSGNSKQEEGYKVMKDILSAHPDVAGVFSCNDPMAVGAAQAIADAGKSGSKDIFVVGFNADEIALKAIKAGQMVGHRAAGALRDGQDDRRPGAPAGTARSSSTTTRTRAKSTSRSTSSPRERRYPAQVAGPADNGGPAPGPPSRPARGCDASLASAKDATGHITRSLEGDLRP